MVVTNFLSERLNTIIAYECSTVRHNECTYFKLEHTQISTHTPHTHKHTHTHTYTHTYTHTHIHTYTHTDTHAYTNTQQIHNMYTF